MADTVITMPHEWRPRAHQIAALREMDRGRRRVILEWHRRAGKDAAVINWCACKMTDAPTSVLYMFPEFKQAKRTLFREIHPSSGKSHIKQAFPERLVANYNEGEGFIRLWNNSILQAGGFDDIDSYMGIGPTIVVFSEWSTSQHGPRAWNLVLPMLMMNRGTAIFPSTPRGKNHYHQLIESVRDAPEWFYQKLTIEDTKLIPVAEIRREVESGSMTEEYARQEFWCFTPDAPVVTARGVVPIADVEIGDLVITHANRWRAVTAVMSREHEGELVEIVSVGNGQPLKCTPEHPVRVCDRATQSYRWVPAGEVQPGDLVTFPRPALGAPLIPAALAKLIAWYVAEGSVSKNHVQFTLHIDETAYHQDIIDAAAELGLEAWVDRECAKHNNVANIGINNCQLADFLAVHCGKGARSKRLPLHIVGGHEQAAFERLVWGDGHRIGDEHAGTPLWSFTTVSRTLAYQFQLLAHSLGHAAAINERMVQDGEIDGRSIRGGPAWRVQVYTGKGTKLRTAKYSVAARVMSVRRSPYKGPVHNLGVQHDESYTAYGRVVHNCSHESPNSGAYYGRAIEKLEETGQVTDVAWEPAMPVYTGWDIGVDDATCIWFCQPHKSGWINVIDYYERDGEGLAHYLEQLNRRRMDGWTFDPRGQLVPHDFAARDFTSGETRTQAAQNLGWRMTVVPQGRVEDGIDAVRRLLPKVRFDKMRCGKGLERLRAYQRKWSDQLQMFTGPLHDHNSHAADAFRTLAMGLRQAGWHLPTSERVAEIQADEDRRWGGGRTVVAKSDWSAWGDRDDRGGFSAWRS